MKIVVFGATGSTGRHVVDQSLFAGHDVTAVVRRPDQVAPRPRLVELLVGGAGETNSGLGRTRYFVAPLGEPLNYLSVVAFVRAPGHSIELIEYKAPAQRGRVDARPCDAGFAHIAFDVDDVDAVLEAVRPHGVVPISPPVAIDQGPNKGRRVVYTRDPDGITIEFIEAN